MSRYTWNLNEIRDIYNELKYKYSIEKDETKKQYLEEAIEHYKKLLYVNKKKKPIQEEINYDCELPFYDEFIPRFKNFYQENNKTYVDLLTGAYNIIRDNYDIRKDGYNISIAFSNNDLFDIMFDFLHKMTPKSYYTKVKEILEKDSSFLNITYNKNFACEDSVTLFDKDYKKKYVLITRHNELSDLICLPHELSHYVYNHHNHEKYLSSDCKYLNEIEGCLINLLLSEYYCNNARELLTDAVDEYGNIFDDKLYFKHKVLGDVKEEIERFIIKKELILSSDSNNKLNGSDFCTRMKKYNFVDIWKDYSKTILYLLSDEEKSLKYGLDYLIALDLYDICLYDPEYAFHCLLNLKSKKKSNDLIPLLEKNSITFMNDDYKNLKKYIKNMTD